MTDKSQNNQINNEDNNSIPKKLSNLKNKFEEEFNIEYSKISKLINYLEKISL